MFCGFFGPPTKAYVLLKKKQSYSIAAKRRFASDEVLHKIA
jgi:hypothetical protein